MSSNYTTTQKMEGSKHFLKQYDKFYNHGIHVNLCNVKIGNNTKNNFKLSRFTGRAHRAHRPKTLGVYDI
jgi:hypothetical protein